MNQSGGPSSIVVSTPRCGRGDTGSIPVLGSGKTRSFEVGELSGNEVFCSIIINITVCKHDQYSRSVIEIHSNSEIQSS
uniref:Uncharacterized protein n=1 Tax=Setaria digitata TaxID=48799 RepID=A0A915PHQ5_9BILA